MSSKSKKKAREKRRSKRSKGSKQDGHKPGGLLLALFVAVVGSSGLLAWFKYFQSHDLDRAERILSLYGEMVQQFGKDSDPVKQVEAKLEQAIRDAGVALEGPVPTELAEGGSEPLGVGPVLGGSLIDSAGPNLGGERNAVGVDPSAHGPNPGTRTALESVVAYSDSAENEKPGSETTAADSQGTSGSSHPGANSGPFLKQSPGQRGGLEWTDTGGRTHAIAEDVLQAPGGLELKALMQARYPPAENG